MTEANIIANHPPPGAQTNNPKQIMKEKAGPKEREPSERIKQPEQHPFQTDHRIYEIDEKDVEEKPPWNIERVERKTVQALATSLGMFVSCLQVRTQGTLDT
jgi:hypothetical protein